MREISCCGAAALRAADELPVNKEALAMRESPDRRTIGLAGRATYAATTFYLRRLDMRRCSIVGLIVATALTGCATPLTTFQKLDYASMRQAGLPVEEKSPATAAALGLLPGG